MWIDQVTFFALFLEGIPPPPENLEAVNVQKGYFMLTWEQPKYGGHYQIDNFTIEQKKGAADSFTILETLPYTQTRLVVNNLEPATKYTMQLSSNNKYGRSNGILLTETTLPGKLTYILIDR